MAYACPVCDALVPDGEHLAHHLAVVAMTRGGDHEAWLDETIGSWQEREPGELADAAVEHAAEVEHDLVDDPRASGRGGPGLGEGHPGDAPPGAQEWPDDGPDRPSITADDARAHAPFGGGQSGSGSVDAETAAILEEARELTERLQADTDGDGGQERDEGDDAGGAAETDSDE